MFVVILTSVLLIGLTSVIHYEALSLLNHSLPTLKLPSRAKLLVVIFVTFIAHAVEAATYGAAMFGLVATVAPGGLKGDAGVSLLNCIYFSAETYTSLGFGDVTASGFPGESAGILSGTSHWRPINIATMSYGYGLSVTPIQLAQAYATVGAFGMHRPITFRRVKEAVPATRVLDEKVSRDLIGLLEGVVDPGGTGVKARVPGYRVAGKTGTAWKAEAGGYSKDRYLAVFAGLVPASRPKLAVLVMIDEPKGPMYYAADVAAPVFSAVTSGALRLMSVAPDDLERAGPQTLVRADQ